MASNYTEHYQLPLWEQEDSFLREEFNEANRKVDEEISMISNSVPPIAFGTYTGTYQSSSTGNQTQDITLGFSPKAVFVSRSSGLYPSDGGAFFTVDAPITFQDWATMGQITENGFTVGTTAYSGSTLKPDLNTLDCVYHYLAIG